MQIVIEDIQITKSTNITVKNCEILRPGENYDFFMIPGGVHDMKAWQLHLYHALQVFFVK